MGEVANDMIEGFACSWCGVYFKSEHGYPVLCRDCYGGASRKERKEFQRAKNRELGDEDE